MAHSEERHYPNPFIGKEDSINIEFDHGKVGKNESFCMELTNSGRAMLNRLEERLFNQPDSMDDYSVYTGSAGIHLIYFHLTSTNKIPCTPYISRKLNDFVHRVSSSELLKGKRFTFLCGDAGPLVIALLISTDRKQQAKLTQKLLHLEKLVYKNVGRDGIETPNELLYGRVGYLYALLFLNQQCGNNLNDPRVIPSSVISKLVGHIIDKGCEGSSAGKEPPLYFEWHDKVYLGAAHGFVGILYILLKAKAYMKPGQDKLVKETVDWMLSQRFPSGNLRSSVGSKEDKLVHWCHGSPGAIFLFLEAVKVYGEEKYLRAALACGEVVWNRGILKRSYSLCHGVAGNAYALMALYKHTKDQVWLKRSCIFARWCFSWGTQATRQPDRPNSLFEGLGGTVYMLHDFLSVFDGTTSRLPKFPAFELD